MVKLKFYLPMRSVIYIKIRIRYCKDKIHHFLFRL